MQFLNPIWLWGLTGLLIPIGIHLLSRKEGKVIRVGSIRHLEETSTRQFKSIRVNEIWLLVLRCLLITLMVLLLSGLSFNLYNTKDNHYLLLEKGMEREPDFLPLVDSLEQSGFEVRWLANDFPLLKDSARIRSKNQYWSLVEEMKKEKTRQIIVLAYNYATGFKGKRTKISENIQWISKSPAATDFTLNAIQLPDDSVWVRKGESNPGGTRFLNSKVHGTLLSSEDKGLLQNEDTISISVYSDPTFEFDKNIIVAALKAVDQTLPGVLSIKTLDAAKWRDDKVDWIIWLSENPFPISGEGNRITYSENDYTSELLTQSNEGWIISKRLDQETALTNNLSLQLASILLPKENAQQRANEFDRRVLPENQLWSASLPILNTLVLTGSSSAAPYLAGLILFILLAERLVAFKRNQ